MHTTEKFGFAACAILITITVSAYAQANCSNKETSLNEKITLVQKDTHPELFLRTLSRRGDFALGFYRSFPSIATHVSEKRSIEVRNKSICDALDTFVTVWPEYVWTIRNGVVNVTPHHVRSYFNSQIHEFFSEEETLSTLEYKVLRIPDLESELNAERVIASKLTVHYGPPKNDSPITLRSSNTTLQNLLNEIVIKHPNSHFWYLEEYGEDQRYLRLTFHTK